MQPIPNAQLSDVSPNARFVMKWKFNWEVSVSVCYSTMLSVHRLKNGELEGIS
jgi:hypothetical protein